MNKIYYIVSFTISNGYRCSCCYQSWEQEYGLSLETSLDSDQLEFKDNHDLEQLKDSIFNLGTKMIETMNLGDEFSGEYSVYYDFHDDRIKGLTRIEWYVPFDLTTQWEEHRKTVKAAKRKAELEAERKTTLRRLEQLNEELK